MSTAIAITEPTHRERWIRLKQASGPGPVGEPAAEETSDEQAMDDAITADHGRKRAQRSADPIDLLLSVVSSRLDRLTEEPSAFANRDELKQELLLELIGQIGGAADPPGAIEEMRRDRRHELVPTIRDRVQFERLADRWKRQSEAMSSHSKAILLRPYQQIIAMGPVAIPLLLERLRDEPDHWFWALAVLTDEDPAQDAASFADARRAWLQWGREHGYID